jgi:aspartate racemase
MTAPTMRNISPLGRMSWDSSIEYQRIINQEVRRRLGGALVRGVINPRSRDHLRKVIDRLRAVGAQGVVAGCTEIELLISDADVGQLPYFPTTRLHALAALDAAL